MSPSSFLPSPQSPPLPRIVMLLLALFYPISFPIAMLLDCVLGKDHGTFFRRAGVHDSRSTIAMSLHPFPLPPRSPPSPPPFPLSCPPFPPPLLSSSPLPSLLSSPELRELVKLHGSKSHENEEPLTYDEVLIVKVTPSHTQVVATLSQFVRITHTHTTECSGNAGQDSGRCHDPSGECLHAQHQECH